MNELALGWNMKNQVPVRIPTPLRKLTQNEEIVQIEGATIRDVINNLERSYPGLKERICDEQNNIRRFVNVFVNDEDIRFLQDTETAVKPGDEVSIFPAIAGG
jgi:molybdopterin synthase sulfur carrier subunit